MEFIAFTNNFFGTGKTKQKALINVLDELEKNNAQAKLIKFNRFDKSKDPFEIMEEGYADQGRIEL